MLQRIILEIEYDNSGDKVKKLKVLMVAGNMHVGGIENQLMHLVRNADKEKFQFDFTSNMSTAFYKNEIEELGGRFILIPKMSWKNPLPYCKTLYRVMKAGQYDVVHAHELFHSGITVLIAWLAGVPCRFAHAHNWRDDDGTGKNRSLFRSLYNVVMRFLLNHFSTEKVACSTWAGAFLYGQKYIGKENFHLIFNSVDTGKFLDLYNKKERGEFCEEDGWKNVINVARISKVKNQVFLIDIAEEIRRRNKKIRILCVGSGDNEAVEEVEKTIELRHLGEYIKLLGVRKDVDVLMRKSSAFVLPSQYEGMPLVMIEAQASGLPCVSADTYSPEVDFGIGLIRWLSLDSGAEAWTAALEEAVNVERASKSAVVEALQRNGFDSKVFAQKICKLYEQDYRDRGSRK